MRIRATIVKTAFQCIAKLRVLRRERKKRQNGMIQTYPLYYNKHQKGKALNKIKEGLESNGYSFSTKDIAEKIANLRNYYGA